MLSIMTQKDTSTFFNKYLNIAMLYYAIQNNTILGNPSSAVYQNKRVREFLID